MFERVALPPLVVFAYRSHVPGHRLNDQLLVDGNARGKHLALIAFDDRNQHFCRFEKVPAKLIIQDGMRHLPRPTPTVSTRPTYAYGLTLPRSCLHRPL